ncbi:MAG TPA: Dot/Icm T4SS effector Wip [Coxiellaceae bacterium]|nr:Dot/Icm T4SS effector Wip [Coxiellaceae bacterium]
MRSSNTIVLQKDTDLDRYPILDLTHPPDPRNQLTIGDLHANALKLVHFLVTQHVLIVTEDQYAAFVRLYNKAYDLTPTREDLDEFSYLLDSFIVNKDAAAVVRLIGDELADRGACDYFILKILRLLEDNGINVEILLSNHGAEFIYSYERGKIFEVSRLQEGQAASMLRLDELIKARLVSYEEIDNLVKQTYKPLLRLLSYSLGEDGGITLYSHAPIGLNKIGSLVDFLDRSYFSSIEYKDATASELAETIDRINVIFYMNIVELSQISGYFETLASCEAPNCEDNPLFYYAWNRDRHDLSRPAEHNGYKLRYVNGHDLIEAELKAAVEADSVHIYNLDNYSGKGKASHRCGAEEEAGFYRVLHSQEYLPTLLFDLIAAEEEHRLEEERYLEEQRGLEEGQDLEESSEVGRMAYNLARQCSAAEREWQAELEEPYDDPLRPSADSIKWLLENFSKESAEGQMGTETTEEVTEGVAVEVRHSASPLPSESGMFATSFSSTSSKTFRDMYLSEDSDSSFSPSTIGRV